MGNNADQDDDGDGVPDVNDLDPLDPNVGAGSNACNKLPNGHFEAGVADWYSSTTMTWITDAAVGTGALRFTGGWVSNIFAAAPGSVYRFSGAYRNTGTVGWTGYGLDLVDANGDEIGERVRTLDPAGPWTRFAVEVTVPANGAYLRPWFSAEPQRTLSLDDLDLRLLGCTDGGIGDNQAPTVANPGEQFAQVGATIDLPLVATDPEGAPLAFSATGLPAGLALDPGTGRIAGSPTTAGISAVTVNVSDGVKTASVLFSWTIQAPGGTAACNRLLDGDFENGLGNWVSNANPSRTTQARTGTGALQFTNGWISVELPVVAGASQTFSGHYRSAAGTGWAGYGFDWVNAAGIEIAEEVRTLAPSVTWSPLTLTAVAPAGATSLKVWFYADPDRTMGLDDLDLRITGCTGGGTPDCNRVDNPGFEQGVGGWQSSTTPVAVTDAAVGSRAARLSGGWMTTGTLATPGQGYSAQALYKASGSDGWAGFGLKFIDDNYQTLAEMPVTLEFAGNWTRTTATAVAPPGTTRAQVWFYADPARTLTIDEVDLRLTSCQ